LKVAADKKAFEKHGSQSVNTLYAVIHINLSSVFTCKYVLHIYM